MDETDIPEETRKKMDRQFERSFKILKESRQELPDDPSAWFGSTESKAVLLGAVELVLTEMMPIPDIPYL